MREVNKLINKTQQWEWGSILRDVSNAVFLEMSNFLPEEMSFWKVIYIWYKAPLKNTMKVAHQVYGSPSCFLFFFFFSQKDPQFSSLDHNHRYQLGPKSSPELRVEELYPNSEIKLPKTCNFLQCQLSNRCSSWRICVGVNTWHIRISISGLMLN